ncbi:MAG: hypothetical protein HYU66_24000 [Armatimonadetes bacterium]|nr:hypothetical protein [Armatimonadota bacterium]
MTARLGGPEPEDTRQKWRLYAMLLVMCLTAVAAAVVGLVVSDRLASLLGSKSVPSRVMPALLCDSTWTLWAGLSIAAFAVLFWSVGQGLHLLSGPGWPSSERVAWGMAQGMSVNALLLPDEKPVAIALPALFHSGLSDAVLPLLLLPWALISVVGVSILTVMTGPGPLAEVDRMLVLVAIVSAIYVASTTSPEGRKAFCLLPLFLLKLVGMTTYPGVMGPDRWAAWLPWASWLPLLVCAPRLLRRPPLRGLLVTDRRLVGVPWWWSRGGNAGRGKSGPPRLHAWLVSRYPPPSAAAGFVTVARTDGALRLVVHDDSMTDHRVELEHDDLPLLREAVRDSGLPFVLHEEPAQLTSTLQQVRRMGPTVALLAMSLLAAHDLGKSTASTLALTGVAQPVLRAAEAGDSAPYTQWQEPLVRRRADDAISLAVLGQAAEALHRTDDAVALYRQVDGLLHGDGIVGRFAADRLRALAGTAGTRAPAPGAL